MIQEPLNFDAVPIPVNVSVDRQEAPRLSRQCTEIRDLLRDHAATNKELAQFALKYTSRVSDLRAAGYVIEVTSADYATGLRIYTLISEPNQVCAPASHPATSPMKGANRRATVPSLA